MAGLFISGLTCFPILLEVQAGMRFYFAQGTAEPEFVLQIFKGVTETHAQYPFLFYGTDWLGFAHILFAILFYGVFKDPIKNIWITQFGIIACYAIFPLALIMGPIRGIPFWWQVVDSSFGILGLMLLIPIYKMTLKLQNKTSI
ncbi:MAG: hypothetical protein COA58_12985 [Bacteroidetes bacterium]|nr:MAG: hypothetical protein COA58_12985 [Bacteroidota bacterium]